MFKYYYSSETWKNNSVVSYHYTIEDTEFIYKSPTIEWNGAPYSIVRFVHSIINTYSLKNENVSSNLFIGLRWYLKSFQNNPRYWIKLINHHAPEYDKYFTDFDKYLMLM